MRIAQMEAASGGPELDAHLTKARSIFASAHPVGPIKDVLGVISAATRRGGAAVPVP
jgi:hypothetical protein